MSVAWVQMGLGPHRFSVATLAYQRFRRAAAARWAKADRAGRAPAMQFLGPEAERVDIEGVILPGLDRAVAPLRRLPALRADCAAGRPLMLVDGLGRVWGRWCLTGVDETQTVFFADGAPRRIEFRLSLTAYGEDLA